jgi:hypothetical protein
LEARLGRAEEKPQSEGEVAAEVFKLPEEGKTIPQVVVALKQPPHVVTSLYREWLKVKRVDINKPIAIKQLEELERRLERRLSEIEARLDKRLKTVEEALEWIGRSVSRRQREDDSGCIHLSQDGYCTYWHWNDRIKGWVMKPSVVKEDEKLKTVYFLNAKFHRYICAACPSYKPRRPRP